MTGTYAGQFVMEGFLNIKLPIYQRVLLTRSIAIVPALGVTFFNADFLTKMDTFLNILQSVQLPFALVPLIKFVSSDLILKEFAISKTQTTFATILGVSLSLMNFYVIFADVKFQSWYECVIAVTVCSGYLSLILMIILEPV